MSTEFVTNVDSEEWAEIRAAVHLGNAKPIHSRLDRLRTDRARLVQALAGAGNNFTARELYRELLADSRTTDEALRAELRAMQDDRHAERMAELAEASNTIAGNANEVAGALKFWTIWLAVATVVLALATITLIFVTAGVNQ